MAVVGFGVPPGGVEIICGSHFPGTQVKVRGMRGGGITALREERACQRLFESGVCISVDMVTLGAAVSQWPWPRWRLQQYGEAAHTWEFSLP